MKTKTEIITEKAFEILERSPEGVRNSELQAEIKSWDLSLHPKTINGIIWKLPENYPDKVYKPAKGLFRLTKYE